MKYLPIHKAAVPFLKEGMVVINKKRWTVEKQLKRNPHIYLVTCGKSAQQLDSNDLAQMYMSVNDIRKLRAFGSEQFIAKYSDYRVTDPHADDLPTHAQLKENVSCPLQIGTQVVLLAGSYKGETRTITAIDHNGDFQVDNLDFHYNRAWFLRFTKILRQDAEYKTILATHEELKKKAHSFDRTSEPTKWLAVATHVAGYHLVADTEPGLKATIALAFAKDPDLVFEVYAKVGEAKAQTLTQKILRFFNI